MNRGPDSDLKQCLKNFVKTENRFIISLMAESLLDAAAYQAGRGNTCVIEPDFPCNCLESSTTSGKTCTQSAPFLPDLSHDV